MDWVISDTHFGHVNIVRYEPCRLAWGDGWEATTEAMLRAWEAVVKPEDTVYHLGDFAMGPRENLDVYRKRLPGRIVHIRGNHDRKGGSWQRPGDVMYTRHRVDHPTLGVVLLRHNPAHFSEQDAAEGDILLHGHLHSNPLSPSTSKMIRDKCVCVSVERLPTAPGPMPFDLLATLPKGV